MRSAKDARLTEGHSFDFCMREGDAQVAKGKHAMEGLDEELQLLPDELSAIRWRGEGTGCFQMTYHKITCQEQRESNVVGCIGSLSPAGQLNINTHVLR